MLKGYTIIEDDESGCLLHQYTAEHVESCWGTSIPDVTVILMAATAWLMLSFSSCAVCGFDSYTVQFRCPQRKLQPSKSLSYITYTSTQWQHDCWLTVQTLYAIYIPTPERISQGHVQNGRRASFSWPTMYNTIKSLPDICTLLYICNFLFRVPHPNLWWLHM